MSKIEMLRVLINQRLTAAAEEIFGVFGRTIAEYEEEISRSKLEIDRQRRLLDLSRKPQISVQVNSSGEEPLQYLKVQLKSAALSTAVSQPAGGAVRRDTSSHLRRAVNLLMMCSLKSPPQQ